MKIPFIEGYTYLNKLIEIVKANPWGRENGSTLRVFHFRVPLNEIQVYLFIINDL